jgi:hypothetical protein
MWIGDIDVPQELASAHRQGSLIFHAAERPAG